MICSPLSSFSNFFMQIEKNVLGCVPFLFLSVCNCVCVRDVYMFSFVLFSFVFSYVFTRVSV